jgi:hypothetical protein
MEAILGKLGCWMITGQSPYIFPAELQAIRFSIFKTCLVESLFLIPVWGTGNVSPLF